MNLNDFQKIQIYGVIIPIIIITPILILIDFTILETILVITNYTIISTITIKNNNIIIGIISSLVFILSITLSFYYILEFKNILLKTLLSGSGIFLGITVGKIVKWGERRIKKKRQDRSIKEKIIDDIYNFTPARKYYSLEEKYQLNLHGWLKRKFPTTEIEITKDSTRPDIVIQDIAIEIKGPTSGQGLGTIPDKIIRYEQKFEDIIVLLFNVHASKKRYRDWKKGMKKNFPEVDIVKIIYLSKKEIKKKKRK
ncbi:MAG: hypothetical protein ACOCRX_06090 [Candidatus Woesearchaeota archaeon]